MIFKKLKANYLRNEERFQYFKEFLELVENYELSGIFYGEYDKLKSLFGELDDAMVQIRKSSYTAEIADTDSKRDMLLTGIKYNVRAAEYCVFDDTKQKAATKLLTVLNTYKSNEKGYAQETGAINNLVDTLQNDYTAEVACLDLQIWVTKLQEHNANFETLLKARDKERSMKPERSVVEISKDLDKIYGNMVRCVEVATIQQANANIMQFAKELTSHIERYNNVLAVRDGNKKTVKNN